MQWALEVNLDAAGGMVMTNTSGTNFTASYPNGQWFGKICDRFINE